MVQRSRIIDCFIMYKSGEVIKFIENIMESQRVELTVGGKSSAEVKIQRGIFQGDVLSSLLWVIVIMLLNHILRKCTHGYKLHKTQVKINHLIYMGDIKLLAKNEKEFETLIQAVRIYCEN